MQEFLNFIAEIMETDPAELTESTTYGEYEKWDSIMQMRLVMAVENKYGVEIPLEEIADIKTLGKLYTYIGG